MNPVFYLPLALKGSPQFQSTNVRVCFLIFTQAQIFLLDWGFLFSVAAGHFYQHLPTNQALFAQHFFQSRTWNEKPTTYPDDRYLAFPCSFIRGISTQPKFLAGFRPQIVGLSLNYVFHLESPVRYYLRRLIRNN